MTKLPQKSFFIERLLAALEAKEEYDNRTCQENVVPLFADMDQEQYQ